MNVFVVSKKEFEKKLANGGKCLNGLTLAALDIRDVYEESELFNFRMQETGAVTNTKNFAFGGDFAQKWLGGNSFLRVITCGRKRRF